MKKSTPKNKKKLTLKDLDARIAALEANSIQPAPYLIPYVVPLEQTRPLQPSFRCPQCGSTGGCWHITWTATS